MTGRPVVSGVARAAAGAPLATAGVAVRAALADADRVPGEVDGMLACGVDAVAVTDLLGAEVGWRMSVPDPESVGAALVQAVDTVAAGRVRTVVCVESVPASSGVAGSSPVFAGPAPAAGWAAWRAPYGADDPAVAVALEARAYEERFGWVRAALARVVASADRHAGTQVHVREQFSSPEAMDPLGERARGAGGAAAVVLESGPRADPARRVRVTDRAAAYAPGPLPEQVPVGALDRAGAAVGAAVRDAGVLLVGDEFAFRVLQWLEAWGCCAPGTAAQVVARGGPLDPAGGAVPVNPHGGHLGLGRRPDLDLVVEAVAQLRGAAGRSQVSGPPRAAAVGLGGPSAAGCVLLSR